MSQKNNLVKNASFLMIAAMISKVIGLLYKSPLSSIVGNMGMGYISLAQNAYMILLMIASFSIPQAAHLMRRHKGQLVHRALAA